MRRRFALVAAVLVASSAGCGSCRETTQGARADASADASTDANANANTLADDLLARDGGDFVARCSKTTAEVELEGGESFEVGGAVVAGNELSAAASFVREGARKGVVFQADAALTKVRTIDLGELAGGDLAPQLATCASCEGQVVVAAFATSAAGPKSVGNRPGAARVAAQRTLVVSAIEGGKASPLYRVPQQADESAAFDLALVAKGSGLVAWDEDSERVVRGIVKVVAFSAGKLGEAIVASPYETDAESPKLVRTAKGEVYLGWLAREAISTDGGVSDADLQGAYLEAPGEERAHQWVEIVALDSTGKPKGAPLAVTARGRGFAASFELVASGDGFDVIVVDGAVRQDGLGSKVSRVPIRAGRPGLIADLVTGGGGAASATVFDSYVTFVDVSERPMVVSLDPPHTLSREPLARGGRFVAALPGAFFSVGIETTDAGAPRASLKRHVCR